ncbi:MAG: hypothetical protein IKO51_03730, partial [Clostridia bacterium]|nr:hypothetical protein [Clostridia bacterium]
GLPLEGKLAAEFKRRLTDEVFKLSKRFAPEVGLYRGRQIAAPTNGHTAGGLSLDMEGFPLIWRAPPLARGLPLEGKLSEAAQRGAKTDEVFKLSKRFAPEVGLYRGRQVAAPTNGHIAPAIRTRKNRAAICRPTVHYRSNSVREPYFCGSLNSFGSCVTNW